MYNNRNFLDFLLQRFKIEKERFDRSGVYAFTQRLLAYNSNKIEGSTLTYAETYAILYNDNSFKIQGKEPREIYEAINHKKALELVFENLQTSEEFDERRNRRRAGKGESRSKSGGKAADMA